MCKASLFGLGIGTTIEFFKITGRSQSATERLSNSVRQECLRGQGASGGGCRCYRDHFAVEVPKFSMACSVIKVVEGQ